MQFDNAMQNSIQESETVVANTTQYEQLVSTHATCTEQLHRSHRSKATNLESLMLRANVGEIFERQICKDYQGIL